MSLVVLDPGALTTVQDRGRLGWAHLGVPRAGALDAPAAALANRLVGNDEDAALLETTVTGVRLRLGSARAVAVTGARCQVRVDGRPVAWGLPLHLRAGAELHVGPAAHGVRSCVAVSGGIAVDPVLGSRSTDTLAWVGPAPLRAGDVLPLGHPPREPVGIDVPAPAPGGGRLRLRPGPRASWLADVSVLDGAVYRVGADSNRVGLRLEGPTLRRARTDELPSEGIVLGSVQVPPSGQPVVFLHDHPVTGGYPVVAVVEPEDLPVCAQAAPGQELRLVLL